MNYQSLSWADVLGPTLLAERADLWERGNRDLDEHERSITRKCPRCGRENDPWPVKRGNQCSPKGWAVCIAQWDAA